MVKTTPVQVEIATHDQVLVALGGPRDVPAGWAIVHDPCGDYYAMSPQHLAERYTTTPPC